MSKCCVCGQPLDEIHAVTCSLCGGDVHYNPNEHALNSCGIVLTRPNICALAFICVTCYQRTQPDTRGTP